MLLFTDTNSIIEVVTYNLVNSVSGDWTLLAIFFMATLGMALVFSKAKASTSIATMAGVTIMFSFIVPGLMFLWWLAIIAAIFVLINGLRKWITSQG